jgi:hypothetical protein
MITIVSGLPRSGTSLMMQMLVAGGMTPLSDGERTADADNPRRYLEWERIKQLPNDPGCIVEAEGKVVKVISRLLLSLPSDHEYQVIFMERRCRKCWRHRIRCCAAVEPIKRARIQPRWPPPSRSTCARFTPGSTGRVREIDSRCLPRGFKAAGRSQPETCRVPGGFAER